MTMRPIGNQPLPEELEELLDQQDLEVVEREDVPDERKVEVTNRIEVRRETEVEDSVADGPLPDIPAE